MDTLLNASIEDFVLYLDKKQIRRFYFVYDAKSKRVIPSHPDLAPLAEFLASERRDFDSHEGIFSQVTREHRVLQSAFVHRTNRGQAAGGTRFWPYPSVEAYFRDGLRLSKGMTRKNALAGLWWGGGKGVIARQRGLDFKNPKVREQIFQEYGELATSLRGCYVTAEDVGTNTEDIDNIFRKSRFVTCISPAFGGSGNPSAPTATGVVRGMEAAIAFLENEDLRGKTVAVQGMGNVGGPLMRYLFEAGVGKIIACDINPEIVEKRKKEFTGQSFEAYVASREDESIIETVCDIFAPCATGAVLNARTIPKLKAKVVCGAANNQLEDADRDDRALFERGILYVPDFLVNRMGIVHCANEQYGYVSNDAFILRHLDKHWKHSIYQMTLKVLRLARDMKETPGTAAIKLADELSLEKHPIFGHRGRQIIASLVEDAWHES